MSSDSSRRPHGKRQGLLQVGEVARRTGKTVRALHLYEELGLIKPVSRTSGGFRLYHPETIERIDWLNKLQSIGFSLSQIQGFVAEFAAAQSGRAATSRVREEFLAKLESVREQIARLRVVERDLADSIAYLSSCETCSDTLLPDDCGTCDHEGHVIDDAPDLFQTLARGVEGGEKLVTLTVVKANND